MTVKLHVTNVRTLPVGEHYDEILPGLTLRARPSGARTFCVMYSRDGRTRRYVIGRTPPLALAEARAEARRVLAEVQLGRDPVAERRVAAAARRLTVGELADRCLAKLELRPATSRDYRAIADREINPALGARPAAALTRAEIRAFLAPIAARAPIRANRVLAVLRRIYSWAVDQELVPASPCVGLRPPSTERRSDRVLDESELRALLAALDVLQACTRPGRTRRRLLLLTGASESAILSLRRPDFRGLDGREPTAIVPPDRPGTKARRGHGRPWVIPLAPQAVVVVRRRLDDVAGQILFPAAVEPERPMVWSSTWTEVLRYRLALAWAAEGANVSVPVDDVGAVTRLVPRWTPHNLRHTLATHMRQHRRVGLDVIALILGQRPRGGAEATPIYDRSELLPDRRAALVAWAEYLDRLALDSAARADVVPLRDSRQEMAHSAHPRPTPGGCALRGDVAQVVASYGAGAGT